MDAGAFRNVGHVACVCSNIACFGFEYDGTVDDVFNFIVVKGPGELCSGFHFHDTCAKARRLFKRENVGCESLILCISDFEGERLAFNGCGLDAHHAVGKYVSFERYSVFFFHVCADFGDNLLNQFFTDIHDMRLLLYKNKGSKEPCLKIFKRSAYRGNRRSQKVALKNN